MSFIKTYIDISFCFVWPVWGRREKARGRQGGGVDVFTNSGKMMHPQPNDMYRNKALA